MSPWLTTEERTRYHRQLGPAVLSLQAQELLKSSTALVTRVGGVGGPAALALVMAGVGKVVIAHGSDLESPDLNRQILGSEVGLGLPRFTQFAERLRQVNSMVEVHALDHEPDDDEALRLANQADIVLSCAADFSQRLRLNRAAFAAGIPLIDAAQWGLVGSLFVSDGRNFPCLACAYPEEPPFEPDFPVLGAIAGLIGNWAALEAIKILARIGEPAWGTMQIVDGYRCTSESIRLSRREDCSICTTNASATKDSANERSLASNRTLV